MLIKCIYQVNIKANNILSLIIIGEVQISQGGSIYRYDILTPGSKYRGGQNIGS